jgi:hypothetical protein
LRFIQDDERHDFAQLGHARFDQGQIGFPAEGGAFAQFGGQRREQLAAAQAGLAVDLYRSFAQNTFPSILHGRGSPLKTKLTTRKMMVLLRPIPQSSGRNQDPSKAAKAVP